MNNDHRNDSNASDRPFPHTFNIGTTLQTVFRNINHAFANSHDGGGQRDISREATDDVRPPESSNSVTGGQSTDTIQSLPNSAARNPSIPSLSVPPDISIPPGSLHDDGEDSMPELGDSDVGGASFSPARPRPRPRPQGRPVHDDRPGARASEQGLPFPVEPATGTRRTRVDDDEDEVRDRRHPSERMGGPAPPSGTTPQDANSQQPLRPPVGALFGLVPHGSNPPAGNAPHDHTPTHTGEGTADSPSADSDTAPGHPPRGAPTFIAGFTLTIPLFGPSTGDQAAQAAGGPGVPPGMVGMDAAAREELFASFAAFFQEFQALDGAREDPERAKKLVAGLEVVPLGLVKRLERVGGAPGGHVANANTGGSSSGCAICWDTLLDAEGDSFSGQFPGSDVAQTHTENEAMDVEAAASQSGSGVSVSTPPSSEAATIISLPCAHVFHASCLLPWFTRAKQATCPTCRFNIDPENLTYTPPRRVFNRPPPVRPDGAVPNAARADGHPPVTAAPPSSAPAPSTEQAGVPPAGLGINPFVAIPGVPVLSFPAIQIPLRPTAGQAPPGDENQGMDVLAIGLDMFVGIPAPAEERRGDPRENAEGGGVADDDEAGTGPTGGDGATNHNGFAQDLRSLIEGLVHTTRNMGPVPPPASDAPRADGAEPQPETSPAAEAAERPPGPPPAGNPRVIPFVPLRPNMFRPMRPMPPRRERKTWILPPAPGPSLRQRVEQREREQGLRCSDTSCGVGPSDDDPFPELSALSTKQVFIRALPKDGGARVCTHAFHPECLVSAERVTGWGGKDQTGDLVDVSCPVCRAVGCVTRDEWESGVSAL